MPIHSRATIKAVPHQHIPQHHKKLNVEVDYDTPDGEDPPNDVHIDYRKLSSFNGDWKPLYDKNIDAHQSWPFELQFDKPEDDGTYDIRVRFTRNRHFLRDGERTGQFFVDP